MSQRCREIRREVFSKTAVAKRRTVRQSTSDVSKQPHVRTRSSAVAERPRDASYQ